MEFSQTLLIVAFLCLVLLVANRVGSSRAMRTGLYALLLLINGGLVLMLGITPLVKAMSSAHGIVTVPNAQAGLIGSLLFAGAATLLLLEPVRRRLAGIFPRADENSGESGFDPTSIPQMVAMVYCVYLLASQVLDYVLAGGLTGLAQNFQEPTFNQLIEQLLIWIVIAFFGAGLLTRRSLPELFKRLGLRWPTVEELIIGGLMSISLIVFAFVTGFILTALTPPDVLKQQTQVSELLSQGIDTITFGLITAACAAIGEEIAFRGALQPIFGLWPTAILFALTHIQYTLTPATLVIVGVAIGLGWLRRKYNTTTSMIAHFFYDFILIVLSIYLRYLQDILGAARP